MPNPLDMVTRGDDQQPLQRVYIDTSDSPVSDATGGGNALAQVTGAPAAPQQQWTMGDLQKGLAALADYVQNGQFSPGTKIGNRLFGTGGEERYQMWPEKMVRSALAAPGEALASDTPVTSEQMIAPAQDIAGMATGSMLFGRPGAGTLGSGPLRVAAKVGDKVYEGKPGEIHAQLLDQHPEISKGIKTEMDLDSRMGFVDKDGKFLDRAQAAKEYAKIDPNYDLAEEPHLITDNAPLLNKPAPVFYSALEHATTNATQDVMSPQQWLGYLKNQPGVKAEELRWTGIENWLAGQKGKVKKEDVKAYLDEHKVEIKDVTKSGPQASDLITDDVHDLGVQAVLDAFLAENPKWVGKEHTAAFERAHERFAESERGEQIYNDAQQQVLEPEGSTKYSSYQLPGGENYREHLLTLSQKNKKPLGKAERDQIDSDFENGLLSDAEYEKRLAGFEKNAEGSYLSSHWDEPNVLAHVRTNDREFSLSPKELEAANVKYDQLQQQRQDLIQQLHKEFEKQTGKTARQVPAQQWIDWEASDKNPLHKQFDENHKAMSAAIGDINNTTKTALHIEEIQSDWHQQGRKQGYQPPQEIRKMQERKNQIKKEQDELITAHDGDPKYPGVIYDKLPEAGRIKYDALTHEIEDLHAKLGDYDGMNDNKYGNVPDAPFKTTWPELALKRMIRHAAENGYDRISWTPGEAQAARYDLSKSLQAVRAYKNNDGTFKIVGKKNESDVGGFHHFGDKIPADKLPDYVGKDLAEKIVNDAEAHKQKPMGPKFEKSYSGVDLKVGGEGMREFYDKMLPKMAEKIGKAHGVKVKQGQIGSGEEYILGGHGPWTIRNKVTDDFVKDFNNKDKALAELKRMNDETHPVHYFDLPQSLKDHAIGKGFPLYMSGVPFPLTPVDHNPFKKKDK